MSLNGDGLKRINPWGVVVSVLGTFIAAYGIWLGATVQGFSVGQARIEERVRAIENIVQENKQTLKSRTLSVGKVTDLEKRINRLERGRLYSPDND